MGRVGGDVTDRLTSSIIFKHFGLFGLVAQCIGNLPRLSLISGFAPFSSSSSTSATFPVKAAMCSAVDLSRA